MIITLLLSVASALDLDEARHLAVTRSLQVERAAAEADAARADHLSLVSGNLPAIAGFADVSTGAGLTSFGFERPVRTQVGAGVQASWTLLAPSDWAAAAAARHSAEGQAAMARWAMISARQDATVAYTRALAAQEAAAAWQQATEDATQGRIAAASLVAAGLRPPADSARAAADEAEVAAAALEAEGQAAARCAELRGLLRLEVRGSCALEPVDLAAPAEPALPEHPALSAAREARAAARSDLSSARLERAVTAEVGSTAAEYNVGDGFGFGWSASVGLDAPILSSGALLQSARAAEDRLAAADAVLADQQIQLEIALVSAEAQLSAARAGLQAREAALEAAQAALDLEAARYREGLAGATDWLAVRRQRDQAAVALAGARASLGEALAGVEAARGVW